MMKLKSVAMLATALILSKGVNAADQKEKARPNILFIEVDDLNYEYLSCFGSPLVQTPNIDHLAKTGVRFQNAVCQGMMCAPSRNSLMTGLYPHNLGFYNNGEMKSLPKDVWTFPQGLQSAGYYTAWIGKCHIRPYKKGMEKTEAMHTQMGFDFVQQTEGRVVLSRKFKANSKKKKKAKKQKKNKELKDWYYNFLKESGHLEQFVKEYPEISTLPEDAYLDGFFTHNAEEFLSDYQDEKPFFLWLNYSVPHGPYDVAQPYHDPFKEDDMPGSTTTDYQVPELLVKKTKLITNEKVHKKEQVGHCAAVNFLDHQVGRVIEALKKNGQFENTIIVFFSDQGVMLGDHQRQHKGTLFRQITNPAMIVSYPPRFQTNKVVDAPVELIDLIQTSLDVAQAEKSQLNHCKTSHSLVPLLTGKAKSVRKVAFGEIDGYVMATDGRYRLIKGTDACLLFDDLKDPKNLRDISGENQGIVKRLSRSIEKWLQKTGPVLPPKSM
ncbi:MAG: sulfatase [Marinifilaceae bacterium]